MDKKQLQKWLDDGVINLSQAEKMLQDLEQQKKEKSSGKIILAFSIIGSVLLGLGAILFIASNWQTIPDFGKIALLLFGTFGTLFIGYYLKYQKTNYPKVGFSLIYLSTFLFGATVFLTAQIYHIKSDSHFLVLLWILGILPLVYILKSKAMAFLVSILFYIWFWMLVMETRLPFSDDLLIYIVYIVSILMVSVGGFHLLKKSFVKVGLVYRSVGVFVASFCMYLLTFPDLVFKSVNYYILGLALVSLFGLGLNLFLNSDRDKNRKFENLVLIGMTLSVFAFANKLVIVYNILFFAVVVLLIYQGYKREKMVYVNFGIVYLVLFLIAKYFDLFYKMLDKSLFFMLGGLILIGGGVFVEKKRRSMKEEFSRKEDKESVSNFNLK